MSSAEGGSALPLGSAESLSATRSASPAPTTMLTESEVKDLIERINVNQAYQNTLKEAQKSLDKALARNLELQVRFPPSGSSFSTCSELFSYD